MKTENLTFVYADTINGLSLESNSSSSSFEYNNFDSFYTDITHDFKGVLSCLCTDKQVKILEEKYGQIK